jgi:hypothetical protein
MTRTALSITLLVCSCSAAQVSPEASLSQTGNAQTEAAGVAGSEGERELARTARAALERDDPEAGPPAAAQLAKRHGGWIASMAERSVTVEVPGDQLDALLVELPSLGKVTERHFAARDVTAAHRDLRVRIDNLKRERERYLLLLERAENVTDATSVEREVERLTSQLELLEAQLQAMGDRVQDASVRLDFSRELRPGPVGYVFYAVYTGVKWLFVRD